MPIHKLYECIIQINPFVSVSEASSVHLYSIFLRNLNLNNEH